VLCGHEHGYERSFPVRGFDVGAGTDSVTGASADTRRPRPVTTVDSGVFDTSQGTVHLVVGCGGTDANPDAYAAAGTGRGPASGAKVFTRANRPAATATPGVYARAAADAVEDATWSARRDTATGYGIAVSPTGDYTLFETFTLVRPRSDGRRWHAKRSSSAISR